MRARFVPGSRLMATALVVAATATVAARPAHACGGCFIPPKQVTVVTGHRMAFSISPQQSVLWDQIEYSGAPQDFAWILPVRAGAQVQLAHDEFFAALDAMSGPVITGPTPSCGNGSGGFACGSSSFGGSAAFDNAGSGNNGVQVISQSVVGPYDTVTVHSTNPNALYDWLVANSYDIPASTRPIVDAYVKEGFDFIALRLAPGQGVQAMQPVRVVMPGATLSLPLRMVAAGVGANVGIVLYVISDGRYQVQNFPNGVVDASKLVWEHAQSQSNYETLATQVMQGGGGRTWLTEFAGTTSLEGTASTFSSSGDYSCGAANGGASYFGGSAPSLAALYFGACLCEGSGGVCPLLLTQEAGLEGGPGASAEAATDAGSDDAAASGDAATRVDAGTNDEAGTFGDDAGFGSTSDAACGADACQGFDDLSVASVGLDPSNTWVTRMRAVLPASALSAADLVVEAAPSQTRVSNQLTASVYDDPTYDPCANTGGGGGGCAVTGMSPWLDGRAFAAGSLAFLAGSLVRRRRIRRGASRRRG